MAYRTLTDEGGRVWEVWDVVPTSAERRRAQEPGEVPDPAAERRSSPQHRVRVIPGWESGWLTFQCAEERRRVVPIPAGWDALSDRDLRMILSAAPPARRFTRLESAAGESRREETRA